MKYAICHEHLKSLENNFNKKKTVIISTLVSKEMLKNCKITITVMIRLFM